MWLVFVLSVALLSACLQGRESEAEPANAGEALPSDTVSATVSEIVASRVPVGRIVRVTGTCLDVPHLLPIGPPPRTRHDWQIADGDAAIYVTGSVPIACSERARVTIVARVAESTLPANEGGPTGTSRYLVRVM